MGQFTLVILWRNGQSGMEKGLSWQNAIDWMAGIRETANQDLVQQVLIMPDDEDPMRITKKQWEHEKGCNMFHEAYQPCVTSIDEVARAA